MGALRNGLVLLGVVILVGGCQSSLHKENQSLWAQNRELQAKVDAMSADLNQRPDPAQLQALQAENARLDAENKKLQQSLQDQPVGGPVTQDDLAGIQVTRDAKTGNVTVTLPGDVLFDSGKAALRSSAASTLDKVANALKKDFAGKQVYVDGYTDTDPISRTKETWKDNLDLSAARAREVASYLKSKGQNNIEPRAFGPTNPKSNKAASRRVEIVVVTR